MIIRFSADGSVALQGHDNFREFKATVPADDLSPQALARLVGGMAVPTDDGKHLWVSIPSFLARFAADHDQAWAEAFSRMIAKAGQFGYVDADRQAVRAHVKMTPA